MKFDLYYADIDLYEITINDLVCAVGDASIKDLMKELQDLYLNDGQILWSKLATINYYYKIAYTDHVVITHICQVEYSSVDEFLANFLSYLEETHPELLL